jgi:hypothetical protein
MTLPRELKLTHVACKNLGVSRNALFSRTVGSNVCRLLEKISLHWNGSDTGPPDLTAEKTVV